MFYVWVCRVLLVFSVTVANFSLGSNLAVPQSPCSVLEWVERVTRNYVHSPVTDSDYKYYQMAIDGLNSRLQGRYGVLPAFDESKIVAGTRSFISLGEGDAEYVTTLIGNAENQRGDGAAINIHAFDRAYDRTKPEFKKLNKILPALLSHPSNFHSGDVQNFDLRDASGKPMLVDEMISSHSLTYVLKGEFQMNRPDRVKKTLIRLLEHLNPNGTLRFWYSDKDLENQLRPIVEELRKEGYLKNHNFPDDPDTVKNYLTIQR